MAKKLDKHESAKLLTAADWAKVRAEPCGVCEEPYHRFCDHDPEHDWSPTACINSLHAEVERLRGVVGAVSALHFAYVGSVPTIGGDALYTECQACQVDWPCETHVALAELEAKP
jgi:hypothetical protein